MTTDTQSTVDYRMMSLHMDRAVHVEVLEQIKVIAKRRVRGVVDQTLHEDISAIQDRMKRRYGPRGRLSTETVSVIREALQTMRAESEDAPLPKGEVSFGCMFVDSKTGFTYPSRSWFEDAAERDEYFSKERNLPFGGTLEGMEQINLRKVTEYERG